MTTKLTLTLKKEVIEITKEFARQKGQSLSELVENYFKLLTINSQNIKHAELSAKVKSLKGILKVEDNFNYKQILEEEIVKRHAE